MWRLFKNLSSCCYTNIFVSAGLYIIRYSCVPSRFDSLVIDLRTEGPSIAASNPSSALFSTDVLRDPRSTEAEDDRGNRNRAVNRIARDTFIVKGIV